MKDMKNWMIPAAAALLVACSPQVFTMNIDMRYPSASGVDLSGKTLSVVWLDDLSGRDSTFSPALAEAFSQTLEKDYFGGEKAIETYRLEKDFGGDYAVKDTLVNLVMATGDDVVFLFEAPDYGTPTLSSRSPVAGVGRDSSQVTQVTVPYTIRLYVYDSMGRDTVQVFKGSSDTRFKTFCSPDESDADVQWRIWSGLQQGGNRAGIAAAQKFLSTWKTEGYTFVYYESPDAWGQAAQAAYEYRWHEAMRIWMTLLDTKNLQKRSCAEYNIAQACFLLGDYDLAAKWLDRSDQDQPISLSPGLRKRIKARQTGTQPR